MKLLFILPSVGRNPNQSYVKTWQMEPLSIAILSAMTPKGIHKIFIDDRLESIPYDIDIDAVAISVETYTALRSYHIAEQFRARGKKVIMGGFHATLQTEEVQEHADCVVKGNAETVWPQLCDDLQSNNLKSLYTGQDAEFKGIMADRSIYSQKKYTPLTLIETGRGCPFTCGFCSITAFSNHKYCARPIDAVVKEIKELRAKTVFFIDDNMAVDMERTRQLLIEIAKCKIRWCGQVSLNTAQHPEILALMRKSGCMGVLIGFESLNDNNLKSMGKNVNRRFQSYADAIKVFRDNGLALYGTFMFGYDYDTLESFDETYKLVVGQKLFFAAFNHVVPFPGTPLFETLKYENRLLHSKWWLDKTYRFGDMAFQPKNFTPDQLTEKCLEYRRKFYSVKSILYRATDFKANCSSPFMSTLFLIQNAIARRDVERRQYMRLGEGP
jgi:radical SAM superfamily enzyme YgiQ (UPF0313 family)